MTKVDAAAEAWSGTARFERGQAIEIRGLHADGTAYRWWPATVEAAGEREISVVWPAGTFMDAPEPHMRATFRRNCRAVFWPERLYFITEAYELGGSLGTLFADIARPRIMGTRLEYTDYELDVVMEAGRCPSVEDEDEFLAAVTTYGYSKGFQEECRRALSGALRVVEQWRPRGDPTPSAGKQREPAP